MIHNKDLHQPNFAHVDAKMMLKLNLLPIRAISIILLLRGRRQQADGVAWVRRPIRSHRQYSCFLPDEATDLRSGSTDRDRWIENSKIWRILWFIHPENFNLPVLRGGRGRSQLIRWQNNEDVRRGWTPR